jgi:type I restriction enzyme S subunit
MNKIPRYPLDKMICFNPPETIKKGTVAKKIPMGKLVAFNREISGYENAVYSSGPKFKNDDTLLAKITPCLENGKTAFINILGDKEIAFGSTEFIVLRAIEGITESRFVYYLARSPAFREKAIKCIEGTSGRKRVNDKALKKQILSVPDIKNQIKISSVLSALDDKIALNNKLNKELEAMAKTLYDYWFIQFDFPNKKGKPYKSSGGKMVYNRELKREIPQGWTCNTIDIFGTIVGGGTPSTINPDNFSAHGIPWITPYDLSENIGNKYITRGKQDVSPNGVKNASLRIYPAGTVLLSSRAPVGYMAIARIPITTNQGFKSFIPDQDYPTEFVYYAVKNSLNTIIQYVSGSTFKEISASVLKTVNVVVPPIDLANQFDIKISNVFKRQDYLEQENQSLASLRDFLLPMLMNGQIRVKTQRKGTGK